MPQVVIAPDVEIDVMDFFPDDVLGENAILSNLLSQVGNLDLLGQGEIVSHFGELVVQVGDRTIRYVGDFTSTVVQSLLGSTSGVTGNIGEIIIEEAGDVIAALQLDDLLGVDLGEVTSLGLLGLDLGDITGGLLGDLLGDVLGGVLDLVDEPVDTLLDTVQEIIDDLIGDEDSGGVPTDGDDTIIGGDDDDDIDALDGDDIVYGGAGDDMLRGGDGNDMLYGGSGDDLLFGDDGNDMLYGGPGRDRLYGGAGDDLLFGEGQGDRLFGESGEDVLRGTGGKDRLDGGADDDLLIGNRGRDVLTGGDGADTFVFLGARDSRPRSGIDVITDFSLAEGDLIDLRELGDLDFVGRKRFSGDGDELRIARKHGDTFVMADTDGDGKAEFTLRLDDKIRLDGDDFLL